jgi:hypothetical protein
MLMWRLEHRHVSACQLQWSIGKHHAHNIVTQSNASVDICVKSAAPGLAPIPLHTSACQIAARQKLSVDLKRAWGPKLLSKQTQWYTVLSAMVDKAAQPVCCHFAPRTS